MPLEQMPDGSFVNFEDGTPPEVVARFKASYKPAKRTATAPQPVRPLTADQKFVQGRVDELKKTSTVPIIGDVMRGVDSFAHEASFHGDDVLTSGIDALTQIPEAVKAGSLDPIKKRYGLNRQALKQYRGEISDENPWSTNIGGIAGAVAAPIGAATGVGKVAGKAAEVLAPITPALMRAPGATQAAKIAEVLGNVGGKLGNSTVGQAARTGANQAALTGFMDTGDLGEAAQQGLFGGTVGTLGATGVHLAGKVGQTVLDRAPANAKNVAYAKIADMLERAPRPGKSGMTYSPRAAERELAVANARGVDARLLDLSPQLQAQAGWMARKPTLKAGNELVELGETRSFGSADRFDTEVGRRVTSRTGDDAYALKGDIDFNRKSAAAGDYAKGGAMDTPIQWTPELGKFFEKSPDASRLIKEAYTMAERWGDDVATMQRISPASGVTQAVPTMRVFDYLKRAFDDEIGSAIDSGRRSLAGGMSKQLQDLKKLIADANPQYADILKRQRDRFQELESVELGQTFLKRLGTREGAKQTLAELQKAGEKNIDELRTGIADALLSMRNKADNPVALMRKYLRSPDQRRVMEYAFGGTKNMNLFDKYIRREIRAAQSDTLLARGKQSATNLFSQVGDANADEAVGSILKKAASGFGFGGPLGGTSNAIRTIDQLRRGIGPEAQEEMARILMGKGEGLTKGIDAAKRAAIARRVAERKRARRAAKAGVFGLPDAIEE